MFNENVPYIALDENYHVVYASEELKEKYSGLFLPDFFRNLLNGYSFDSFVAPLEFHAGMASAKDIKLVFIKDGDVLKCIPVKSHIYGENQHKNIHYRLREPLTSIFAILPIIADNIAKDNGDKAIINLETVNRQTYKLLKNVNNISLVDRVMSGNIPAIETVDFSSLLENLVFSAKAIHNNITIKCDADKHVYVKGNKGLLTCAVLNLISNSINYKTDENVEIEISLKDNGDNAAFSYSDNSKGIKDQHLADIFKPYYSKDPFADGEMDPSLGLGLFITKTAFEQIGGKIMTSSVFGKGVKYIVNMPVAENDGHIMESSPSELLLNRYSDLFVQLCDSCNLPSLK